MKRNRVLKSVSSVLAFAGVLASLPATANAATTKYYPTKIEINGTDMANPGHLVSPDPFSGGSVQTSYLPVWYVDEALQRLGITPTWNGAEGVLSLTVPATMQVNYPSSPTPMAISDKVMKIEVNGQVITYAPRIAALDEGSKGVMTTYAPIYYLEKALQAIGIKVGWDGTNWTMDYIAPTPSAPTTPSGDTKLAAVLAFAKAVNLAPNNNAGADPYNDVPSEDWPIVSLASSNFTWSDPSGDGATLAMNMPLFKADSSTSFGSKDAVDAAMIDRAALVFNGLSPDHTQYLPNGSLTGAGDALGLNSGVSNTGSLSASEISVMMSNIQSLERGYVDLGNGTYLLRYRPNPENYWSTSIPASVYTQDWASSIGILDKVVILSVKNGAYETKVPGFSDQEYNSKTGNYVQIQGVSSPESYSVNGGVTWGTANGQIGYDSMDVANGGQPSAPSGVLIKDVNGSGITVSYRYNGQQHVFVSGGLWLNNGTVEASYR